MNDSQDFNNTFYIVYVTNNKMISYILEIKLNV